MAVASLDRQRKYRENIKSSRAESRDELFKQAVRDGNFIEQDISILDLTTRSENCLRHSDIGAVCEFVMLTPDSIKDIRHAGPVTRSDITRALEMTKAQAKMAGYDIDGDYVANLAKYRRRARMERIRRARILAESLRRSILKRTLQQSRDHKRKLDVLCWFASAGRFSIQVDGAILMGGAIFTAESVSGRTVVFQHDRQQYMEDVSNCIPVGAKAAVVRDWKRFFAKPILNA